MATKRVRTGIPGVSKRWIHADREVQARAYAEHVRRTRALSIFPDTPAGTLQALADALAPGAGGPIDRLREAGVVVRLVDPCEYRKR